MSLRKGLCLLFIALVINGFVHSEDSLVVIELGFGYTWPVSPVETGTSDAQLLTVTNFATTNASAFSDAGALAGTDFDYTGGAYPGTLGTCPTAAMLTAGSSCTIEIIFSPTTTGAHNGIIELNYTLSGFPYVTDIEIFADAEDNDITITPNPHDFGLVSLGATVNQLLTLTNTNAILPASAITDPLAAVALPFRYNGGVYPGTGGNCPAVPFALAATASCQIDVEFVPTVAGEFADTLSLTYTMGGVAGKISTANVDGIGHPSTGTCNLPAIVNTTTPEFMLASSVTAFTFNGHNYSNPPTVLALGAGAPTVVGSPVWVDYDEFTVTFSSTATGGFFDVDVTNDCGTQTIVGLLEVRAFVCNPAALLSNAANVIIVGGNGATKTSNPGTWSRGYYDNVNSIINPGEFIEFEVAEEFTVAGVSYTPSPPNVNDTNTSFGFQVLDDAGSLVTLYQAGTSLGDVAWSLGRKFRILINGTSNVEWQIETGVGTGIYTTVLTSAAPITGALFSFGAFGKTGTVAGYTVCK